MLFCVIWYHLYNFKNIKNTHGGVLLLQSNTPPWVLFTFFIFYKWYKIAKSITCISWILLNKMNMRSNLFSGFVIKKLCRGKFRTQWNFYDWVDFGKLLTAKSYNLGQKVGDKFTKLSKIGFSMECFTADFQNLAFGWTPGYSPSNPRLRSFGNSWGNSYIHFLVIII